MNARRTAVALASVLATLLASAADAATPVLRDAWIALPPPGARVAAAYLVLDNRGGDALEVRAVRAAGFARAEVHETVRDGARTAMRPRPTLPVDAGTTLAFAPGGLHLMLWDPLLPPRAGASHQLELVLADGRVLTARAEVRDLRPAGGRP